MGLIYNGATLPSQIQIDNAWTRKGRKRHRCRAHIPENISRTWKSWDTKIEWALKINNLLIYVRISVRQLRTKQRRYFIGFIFWMTLNGLDGNKTPKGNETSATNNYRTDPCARHHHKKYQISRRGTTIESKAQRTHDRLRRKGIKTWWILYNK